MIYIRSMFKDIQAGLSRFLGKRWIPIVVIIVICAVLLFYSSSKSSVLDRMDTGYAHAPQQQHHHQPQQQMPVGGGAGAAGTAVQGAAAQGGFTMQPVANPSDLLPQDSNSQWASLNPLGGGNVAMPDLLSAGYHIGLDTIGQTLKNANLQLRSDPIIEKKDIGPWNQSTYEPDYGRVPLEVGHGQR